MSKQHCIGVSRSSPIYMKAEARSGAAVGISLFFPAIQCFQPKFKIPFHWRKLLHLANDLFTDKDSLIPLAFHMLPSEVRYCFMSPSSLVDLQLLKVCPHAEAPKWGFRTMGFWTGWFGFDLDPCELVMEGNIFPQYPTTAIPVDEWPHWNQWERTCSCVPSALHIRFHEEWDLYWSWSYHRVWETGKTASPSLQFAKCQLSPLTPILPGRIKPQPVQPEHRCFQDDDVEFISKLQFKAKHKGNLNE